nr:uncharacterized protein LOC106686416 [Halyomorpha halys]
MSVQDFFQGGACVLILSDSVQLSSSERETVQLVEVEVGTSGRYKCEVSGEAPYFHTATNSAELLVLVLPAVGPTISGAAPRYAPGDQVNLICASGPAHPTPSLAWYINGSPVNDSQVTEYPPETDEEGLMTSRLGLTIRAEYNSEDPEGGEMRLKCASSLGSIYWASREATLGPATSKLHTLRHIFSGGVRPELQLTMFLSILIFLNL